MKCIGIYSNSKHLLIDGFINLKSFILSVGDNFHRLLAKSDDWVESVPYDTLQMCLGITFVIMLVVIILGTWAIMRIEDTPNERNKRNESKKIKQ